MKARNPLQALEQSLCIRGEHDFSGNTCQTLTTRSANPHPKPPENVLIDSSQTNREAILSCDTEVRLQVRSRHELKPIRIRQGPYLNNRAKQDHCAIRWRIWPMLGFGSMSSAREILNGVEMVHMMRKGQAKYACNPQPPLPSSSICSRPERTILRLSFLAYSSGLRRNPQESLPATGIGVRTGASAAARAMC